MQPEAFNIKTMVVAPLQVTYFSTLNLPTSQRSLVSLTTCLLLAGHRSVFGSAGNDEFLAVFRKTSHSTENWPVTCQHHAGFLTDQWPLLHIKTGKQRKCLSSHFAPYRLKRTFFSDIGFVETVGRNHLLGEVLQLYKCSVHLTYIHCTLGRWFLEPAWPH